MSPDTKRDIGHSIFQRLLNQARAHGDDFNLLLFRYGNERLLYRLSVSPHAMRFILKGAGLFLVWKGQSYRVTRDADLLGVGSADINEVRNIFIELCRMSGINDGVEFKADTVISIPIREEQAYHGIRITLTGVLHQARIPLQIDIGFGDIITPKPERVEFPTLLNGPAPQLLAYPRYTMAAEKFETMVRLGIANSRMKDFYDIWLMSRLFEFNGAILCEAIQNTFQRRSTVLPEGLPLAFRKEFRRDNQKHTQWQAFVRKSKPESVPANFDALIFKISEFLMPMVEAAQGDKPITGLWPVNGPWSD